ncbi:MAG: AraC family transcriptional regulator [Deltaproteobacteria bacterium]|nr:AraC family transcriptional regulator [Deltaproteobacteria bacterium]
MRIHAVGSDSALGRFAYHEWRPPLFAGLVDRLWYSEGRTVLPRKRIFPNGMIELLLNLGEPMRLVEGAGAELFARGSLSGLHSGPIVIEMAGSYATLGIRLRPAGAYALLARPLHAVSDYTVDLHDLVGTAAAELAERCHDAATVEARFTCAAAWLHERLRRARGVDAAVAWSIEQLERSAGEVAIAELRERTGWSKTRLASVFREQIGFTPKHYARILRFRRLLALLHPGDTALIDAALEAGYYDQPHMTGEFRAFTGMTPRAFVAAQRYAQTFSVAQA